MALGRDPVRARWLGADARAGAAGIAAVVVVGRPAARRGGLRRVPGSDAVEGRRRRSSSGPVARSLAPGAARLARRARAPGRARVATGGLAGWRWLVPVGRPCRSWRWSCGSTCAAGAGGWRRRCAAPIGIAAVAAAIVVAGGGGASSGGRRVAGGGGAIVGCDPLRAGADRAAPPRLGRRGDQRCVAQVAAVALGAMAALASSPRSSAAWPPRPPGRPPAVVGPPTGVPAKVLGLRQMALGLGLVIVTAVGVWL